jgi:hypothetical protein
MSTWAKQASLGRQNDSFSRTIRTARGTSTPKAHPQAHHDPPLHPHARPTRPPSLLVCFCSSSTTTLVSFAPKGAEPVMVGCGCVCARNYFAAPLFGVPTTACLNGSPFVHLHTQHLCSTSALSCCAVHTTMQRGLGLKYTSSCVPLAAPSAVNDNTLAPQHLRVHTHSLPTNTARAHTYRCRCRCSKARRSHASD